MHYVCEIGALLISIDKLSLNTNATEYRDWLRELDDLRHIHKARASLHNRPRRKVMKFRNRPDILISLIAAKARLASL